MARIKATFRAGDMVKVKDTAFGTRWDPNLGDVPKDTVSANYHVTRTDTERWYEDKHRAIREAAERGEDTFDLAFDSAGESRLPPKGGYVSLHRGTAYRVLRARCRESFSYHNATGGWTKLLHLESGREVFIKMTKLEKVEA